MANSCEGCAHVVRGEFATQSGEAIGLKCCAGLPAEWRLVRASDVCGQWLGVAAERQGLDNGMSAGVGSGDGR